ncbi:MAG: CDP-glycerol glycerophosphotransferase family protein [Prevotella sp.]|nr:CDP-glycerol glycerophosphotransferase family protein [Prevotella sp.]
MSKLSLINRVKYSRTFYTLYYYIGSWAVGLLKLFVKADDKLIVFSCFGGRKYDDSPKAIYEAMLQDARFAGCRLVWAFMHPDGYQLPQGEKVKIDTLAYYKTLLQARVWVTNSSMLRGLYFTGKHTFQLNTWHGSAIKRMGDDINSGNTSFGIKGKSKIKGVMLAQGQYDVEVFSRAFHTPVENFRVIGLPRNDELAHATKERQAAIKQKLVLSTEKKVILYAPTFREYDKDGGKNVVLTPPINFRLWQERLGMNYVLLFRAHYEVARVMGVEDTDFVKDVSAYPSLNDLILASDLLISDYSSIFFDYAIQGKPMLCYVYDYDKYAEKRGMYFDIRQQLPSAESEEDLLKLIEQTDVSTESGITRQFQRRYVTAYGDAAQQSIDIIHEAILT